jgi:formamidopyrimidine-DNA glycosylase
VIKPSDLKMSIKICFHLHWASMVAVRYYTDMPELPEVETVVRTLEPKLKNRRIVSVTLVRRDILQPANADLSQLAGQTVQRIARRGKKILIYIESGILYIHLGMTGRLTMESSEMQQRPHTHLLVNLSDGGQMRFRDPRRFGGVWWLPLDHDVDSGLGPEALTIRPIQLAQQLARTSRAIKTALLDQSILAGLGNIYADESLFAAGIHPTIPANKLAAKQISNLTRAIRQTLRRAILSGGSSLRDYVDANGEAGAFQKLHRVYDRAGKPCRKCKILIERIVLGGRSTHYCPKCQR